MTDLTFYLLYKESIPNPIWMVITSIIYIPENYQIPNSTVLSEVTDMPFLGIYPDMLQHLIRPHVPLGS